jgi:hypothetical protein
MICGYSSTQDIDELAAEDRAAGMAYFREEGPWAHTRPEFVRASADFRRGYFDARAAETCRCAVCGCLIFGPPYGMMYCQECAAVA